MSNLLLGFAHLLVLLFATHSCNSAIFCSFEANISGEISCFNVSELGTHNFLSKKLLHPHLFAVNELQIEHSLKPESLRSVQLFSLMILVTERPSTVSSLYCDVIFSNIGLIRHPENEGLGLLEADEMAELRLDLAESVVILPKALIAFPVFY